MRLCKNDTRRWQRICLMVEDDLLPGAGVPALLSGLSQISYALYLWPVFFALALQYNSFTALHGVPVSTVFCTNNFRQMTIHALIWRRLRHTHAPRRLPGGRPGAAHQPDLRDGGRCSSLRGVAFSVFTLEWLGTRQMLLCAAFMLALWLWMTLSRREENTEN